MDWITDNSATIIIGCLLLAAVIPAVRSVVKTQKSGGCSGCAGCSRCKSCPHEKSSNR